jgi:cellulose synthase/poly-beta-1,6-N-acetylglucosamine synthase-like glycosyltransferase
MLIPAIALGCYAAAIAIVATYVAWLSWGRLPGAHAVEHPAGFQPARVLIVVPTYNEAPLIERKLANLPQQYPVVIVDGGSTDGTLDLIRAWLPAHENFTLLATTQRNKTAQLNDALRLHPSEEWILVTDADALLEPDTIDRLLATVAADPRIGVAGVRVRPTAAHALESLHWRATDWLRARESDRGSAAIVAAPCYLAHRDFLAHLPDDTLADDVHVACRAMRAGRRVGHADATVLEVRSPRTLGALLRHKYRKADAYLREIVRFLPEARRIPRPMRAIFLWRAALLTLVPLLGTLGSVALAVSIATHTAISLESIAWAALIAALLLVVPQARKLARGCALAAVLAAVSAAALFTYPFSRQVASFPKILQPSEYPSESP